MATPKCSSSASLAFATGLLLIAATGDAAPPRAIWLWEREAYLILDEESVRSAALGLLGRKGIGAVYFYADAYHGRNALADEPAKVRAALETMHERGLRVYALLGSQELKTQEYVLPERRDRAIAMFERVLDYDGRAKPSERFDGVNLDIEPYLLEGWSERKEELALDYLELGAKYMALKRARDPKLVVGPATPFWWDGIEGLSWNGRTARLSEHVQDLYDYVSLMDYRNFAAGGDGMIAHAADEVAYGSKVGKPVWIGIETLPGDLPKLTFHGKDEAALERELALVEGALRSEPSFGGFVIHHFASYRDWLAAQSPAENPR
jgi:hypothetical protein